MSHIKGPIFKSYTEATQRSWMGAQMRPAPDRSLPEGQSWGSHPGRKARLRNLRQVTQSIRNTKDPALLDAVRQLYDLTKGEPEPEYAHLHLLAAAKQSSDDTGVTILDAVEYMVEKFTDAKEPNNEESPP